MKRRNNVKSRHNEVSFASAAQKIGAKYKDRDFNSFEKNGFLNEMSQLVAIQDVARSKEQARASISDYRTPREVSKYGFGTPVAGLTNVPNAEMDLSNPMGNALSLYGDARGYDLSGANYTKMAPVNSLPTRKFEMPQAAPMKLPPSPLGTDVAITGATGAGTEGMGKSIYNPLAIGKGLEFLSKVALTASGATKIGQETNPYEDQIRNMIGSRAFNNDALVNNILGDQNAANASASGINNIGVQQALRQNATSQGMQVNSQNQLTMQQGNNQLAGENAQILNNLGQQRVASANYQEQLNNQGLASQQLSLQNLAETVGGVGQKLTDYRAGIAQQNLVASALSTADFKFGDVSSIIKDAVSMKNIDPSKAIEIIQSSQGKSKDQVVSEVQKAVEEFRNSFKK